MGRIYSTSIEENNAYRILVAKPKGKRQLKTQIRRLDKIRMLCCSDGIVWSELDWSASGYGPVEGFCEHSNVFSDSTKR
jgi:hypothetical protein